MPLRSRLIGVVFAVLVGVVFTVEFTRRFLDRLDPHSGEARSA